MKLLILVIDPLLESLCFSQGVDQGFLKGGAATLEKGTLCRVEAPNGRQRQNVQ